MIKPTEKDIGKRVEYTRENFFGKPNEVVYGTLESFSDKSGFIHWDNRNNQYMWIAFLSELDWCEEKKKKK